MVALVLDFSKRLEFTPLEFKTALKALFKLSFCLLEFTPLEFETKQLFALLHR